MTLTLLFFVCALTFATSVMVWSFVNIKLLCVIYYSAIYFFDCMKIFIAPEVEQLKFKFARKQLLQRATRDWQPTLSVHVRS